MSSMTRRLYMFSRVAQDPGQSNQERPAQYLAVKELVSYIDDYIEELKGMTAPEVAAEDVLDVLQELELRIDMVRVSAARSHITWETTRQDREIALGILDRLSRAVSNRVNHVTELAARDYTILEDDNDTGLSEGDSTGLEDIDEEDSAENDEYDLEEIPAGDGEEREEQKVPPTVLVSDVLSWFERYADMAHRIKALWSVSKDYRPMTPFNADEKPDDSLQRDRVEVWLYKALKEVLEEGGLHTVPTELGPHSMKPLNIPNMTLDKLLRDFPIFSTKNSKTGGLALTMPTVFTCGELREGGRTRSSVCAQCCYADRGSMAYTSSIYGSVIRYYLLHRVPDALGMDDTEREEYYRKLARRGFRQALGYVHRQERVGTPRSQIDSYIRFSVAGDLTPQYTRFINGIAEEIVKWEQKNGKPDYFRPIIYSRSASALRKVHDRVARVLSVDHELYERGDWRSWDGARAYLMVGTWGDEEIRGPDDKVIPYITGEGARIEDVQPDIIFISSRALGRTLPPRWLGRACPENRLPIDGKGFIHEKACQNCARSGIYCFTSRYQHEKGGGAPSTDLVPIPRRRRASMMRIYTASQNTSVHYMSALKALVSAVHRGDAHEYVNIINDINSINPQQIYVVAAAISTSRKLVRKLVTMIKDNLGNDDMLRRILDAMPMEYANSLLSSAILSDPRIADHEPETDGAGKYMPSPAWPSLPGWVARAAVQVHLWRRRSE